MNYFINLKNGKASIDTSRLINASATDMQDIIDNFGNVDSEPLTASLDLYIEDECNKMDLSSWDNKNDLETIVFSEQDFLGSLERDLEIDFICDNPDLRDPQRDLVDDRLAELENS